MRNAYTRIQAEGADSQAGTRTAAASGGRHVTAISAGDWLRFDRVDFTSTAPRAFTARIASGAAGSGVVQVRVGSRSAAPVASFSVRNTGGWQQYWDYAATANPPRGVHTVYVTFAGDAGDDLMNLDSMIFNGPHG